MEYSTAFYIGTHDNSFRSGEPAKIMGVKILFGDRLEDRPCFELEYADGAIDYSPICDYENYKIVSGDKISKKYIIPQNKIK